MTHRKYLAALGLIVAAACSGEKAASGDAASGAAQAGAARSGEIELADITAYRLTMNKVDAWMNTQRNVAKAVSAMSPAERQAFKARENDDDDTRDDLDAMVARIESEPVMAKAVRDAGLSAREFSLITMSIVQSGMAAAVLQMRPNDNQDSLIKEMKANPENVRFMRENEAVFKQKQQALQAELKAAGMTDDDESEEHEDH